MLCAQIWWAWAEPKLSLGPSKAQMRPECPQFHQTCSIHMKILQEQVPGLAQTPETGLTPRLGIPQLPSCLKAKHPEIRGEMASSSLGLGIAGAWSAVGPCYSPLCNTTGCFVSVGDCDLLNKHWCFTLVVLER